MMWSDEQLVRAIKIASEEIVRNLRRRSLYRVVEEESVLQNLSRRLRQDSKLEQLYLAGDSSTPEIIRQAHFAFFEQFHALLVGGQRQGQSYEELARYFYRRALSILYEWAPQFVQSKHELASVEFRPLALECSQAAVFSVYRRITRAGGLADPSRFYTYTNHVIKNQCRVSLAKCFAKGELASRVQEPYESRVEEELEIDSADQSQEEIEQLLHFPAFDLNFLSDEQSKAEIIARPAELVTAQGTEVTPAISSRIAASKERIVEQKRRYDRPTTTLESQVADETIDKVLVVETSVQDEPKIGPAQRSGRNGAPADATVRFASAAKLIESGDLVAGLDAYQTAREQIKSDDRIREELDARIRELRQQIRVEKRLEHEAQAALALERDGKWREAEETYRRIATETASQQRQDELKRAVERCHVERQVAELLDSAVKAYESHDLISAMNRLTRVIRQRPGYSRGGTTAEALLARVKKDWEKKSTRSSVWPRFGLQVVVVAGFMLGFCLIIGAWNIAVPHLLAQQSSPVVAAPTLSSPNSLSAIPPAPSGGGLSGPIAIPARAVTGPENTAPSAVSTRAP